MKEKFFCTSLGLAGPIDVFIENGVYKGTFSHVCPA
jgi:hypothetical protein